MGDFIGGTVTWTAATGAGSGSITAMEVYLSDFDGSHTGFAPTWGNVYIGSVATGTNSLTIPLNTSLAGFTHIWVHTRSVSGVNPDGAKVELCDVEAADTVALQLEASTTA